MRNFILLPLLSILPLLVLSETSQHNNFSECKGTSHSCSAQTSFNISYPFREPSMPDHCGLPGYDVTCKNNNTDSAMLVLEINNKEYKVGDINYEHQIINLVNTDFLGDGCPLHLTNTTVNLSRFSYTSNDLNLTLHFNCSLDVSSSMPNHVSSSMLSTHQISFCPRGSNLRDLANYSLPDLTYYSLPEDDPSLLAELLRTCNSKALIPIINVHKKYRKGRGIDWWGAIKDGFDLNWTPDGTRWCKGCEDTGGVCLRGWENLEKPKCGCKDGSITSDTCNSKGERNKTTIIIEAGSASMIGFLLVCLSLALYFYKHRKVSMSVIFQKKNLNNNQKIEAFLEGYESITPRRYSYSNVKKITKAFQEKLGQGGYGTVFKGTLDNGHMVAVKILNDSKGDGEEFINEVASIGRTSHVNVVNLLGFCYEGSKRALIYDFMCNGSLEKLLYSEMSNTTFDWQKLCQIAIGIARGLEYLHRGCSTRIVHFDIKPHNILLDQDFCPKISDFGLAKLCLKKESIISIAGARGTIGYIAPEVFSRNFGLVSSKSDVYSYGMMVLEIAGGRKNPNEGAENSSEKYFPHWIYAQLDQNGDLLSCGVSAESEEIARKMVLVGLWCIQTMPGNRPSMSRVIEMMEGSVDDLKIPPKPYLSSSPFGSIVGTSSIQDICSIDCIDSSVHS